LFQNLLADLRSRTPTPLIAARFHNGVAEMVRQVVTIIRQETGITHVALSGGVWQNITLLTKTVAILQTAGFTVLTHRQVPPNDGGVALGQAVIAAQTIYSVKRDA
jgi:hydrogenase maturation protein HypF